MKKDQLFIYTIMAATFAFLFFGKSVDRKEKYKINPEAIIKSIHQNR